MGTERSLTKPIQKNKIAQMLYEKDELRKIRDRQLNRPLEKHLEKSYQERLLLAKKRVIKETKRLP